MVLLHAVGEGTRCSSLPIQMSLVRVLRVFPAAIDMSVLKVGVGVPTHFFFNACLHTFFVQTSALPHAALS